MCLCVDKFSRTFSENGENRISFGSFRNQTKSFSRNMNHVNWIKKNFSSSNEIMWDYCIPDSLRTETTLVFQLTRVAKLEETTQLNAISVHCSNKRTSSVLLECRQRATFERVSLLLLFFFAKTDDVIWHEFDCLVAIPYWMKNLQLIWMDWNVHFNIEQLSCHKMCAYK